MHYEKSYMEVESKSGQEIFAGPKVREKSQRFSLSFCNKQYSHSSFDSFGWLESGRERHRVHLVGNG
jgi:hypothetical protein